MGGQLFIYLLTQSTTRRTFSGGMSTLISLLLVYFITGLMIAPTPVALFIARLGSVVHPSSDEIISAPTTLP